MSNLIKEMKHIKLTSKTDKMLFRLPVVFDWVKYKGETVFMAINYERSHQAKKPMIDIAYCATRALNGCFLKTVQWDKKKFSYSELSSDEPWIFNLKET